MSGESNHIDEIIRRKFESFEPAPPAGAWDRIRAALDSAGPSSKGPAVFTILTVISLIIALFFIVTNINEAPAFGPRFSPETNDDYSWSESFIDNYSGYGDSYSDAHSPADKQGFYDFQNYGPAGDEIGDGNPIDHVAARPILVRNNNRIEKARSFERFESDGNHNPERQDHMIPGAKRIGSNRIAVDEKGISPAIRKQGKAGWNDYHKTTDHDLRIGFEFLPEGANYPSDRLNVANQSYHLSLTYGISNLYLKTGIGVRSMKDKGEYTLEYNKYLGNYQHVYEVTFDSTENGIVPTYHTFNVDVYDTVNHVRIGESAIRSHYLDIPLLIGYRKDFGKFALHIHAGPNVSFLMGREAATANYPEEQIRILNRQQYVPARMKVNWQLMAGAGIDYHLTDRFDLSIEPAFRYYLSPEFSDSKTQGGIGFGLRVGLSYSISK